MPRAPRRTETIAFRVTSEDRARLEQAAADAGLSLSAFITSLTDRRLDRLRTHLDEIQATQAYQDPVGRKPVPPELLAELRRIGNNINQIAHAVNSGLPADTRRLVQQMKALLDLIHQHNLSPHSPASHTPRQTANDPAPAQTRNEFQRSVHLYPAGSPGAYFRPRIVDRDR